MFEKANMYSPIGASSSESDIEEIELPMVTMNGRLPRIWSAMLKVLVAASLLLNLAFLIGRFKFGRGANNLDPSEFAGLTRDVPIPWVHYTEYANANLSEANILWEAINIDPGLTIALPNTYTESKKLPKAQPFIWDRSQGIYVVNGYHNLHCLKSIHASLSEYNLNRPQSYPLEHVTHCLDSLRRDVLCSADDTPRWTSADKKPESGVGQYRQCRDWSKLESWVTEHNACYGRIDENQNRPEIERYKFCPPDSPYYPGMRAYFERVLHEKID